MDQIYRQIVQLSRQYQADKIVLFGSRTRGDHRENSDIDIAVFGMPTENQVLFWDSVSELPTLLEFDIVFLSPKTDEKLVRNIEKDGVILMDKFAEKYGCKFDLDNAKTYDIVGCKKCNNTGYYGRIGIFEVLSITDTIRELITRGASSIEIRKAALEEGYRPLIIDGIGKVISGITTLDELNNKLVIY